MNKRKLGSEKEHLAAGFLKEQGYRIITLNYYCRAGEIDIIAKDGDTYCFIEVKYRKNTDEGYPEEAVDARKAARITRSALLYLNMCGLPDTTPCRFDVVAILGQEIHLIRNAFDAVI